MAVGLSAAVCCATQPCVCFGEVVTRVSSGDVALSLRENFINSSEITLS